MSRPITIAYILAGAYAGQTVTLGKYSFVNGRCEVTAVAEQQALHGRSLELNWQALPEGDPRIKELNHGKREVPANGTGPNGAADLSSGGQPSGSGAEAGGDAGTGAGAADAATGGAKSASSGADGHAPELNQKLLNAVHALDVANDAHWTKDGKPAITAVAQLYGSTDVTRKMIDAAAPGFVRVAPVAPPVA